jgi:hypothetical protein
MKRTSLSRLLQIVADAAEGVSLLASEDVNVEG